MTSPAILVIKYRIIFQKGLIPQNVQPHCLLPHTYSVLHAHTVYARTQSDGFGVHIDNF